jgi:hypothetical protein
MIGPIQPTTSHQMIFISLFKRLCLPMRFLIAVRILCEYFMIFSLNTAILSLKALKVWMMSSFIIQTEESRFNLIIKVNLELIFRIALRSLCLRIQEVQFKTIKKIGFTIIIILVNLNKLTHRKTLIKKGKIIIILLKWK